MESYWMEGTRRSTTPTASLEASTKTLHSAFGLNKCNTASIMNLEKTMPKIREFMENILLRYADIRGKELEPNSFWDAVVISASDDSQMQGYEKQIAAKQNRKEIPLGVPFHVFADPPGYKIGCGGSTIYVLDKLSKMYENRFHEMRILLIPAGGYSQRLPNLTVLGKLFCPLPFGEANYQMLDLILACYLPFLKNMSPGVFLASSDAIISYCLNDNDIWNFTSEGFTALAHLSSVSIGVNHGVYVLPEIQYNCNSSTFMSECLQVLQKPSVEEMHQKGAVTNFNYGIEDEEIVYSDSVFFFDHKIVTKLINFYNSNIPLKMELNAYGDFLQPLGSNASPSYIVDKVTNEELALMKSALYRNLHGTNLSVLVLKNSLFHHLGTKNEYVDSFCFKNNFASAFPVCAFNFSAWSVSGLIPLYIQSTILHSVIHPLSVIQECTVVEYCDLNIVINIGKNCIVSNIQLDGYSVQRLPCTIPDDTFIHTVPVQDGFVTIACGMNDDIKKTYDNKDVFEINFFGKKLKNCVAPGIEIFDVDCKNFSLWNAKIFPIKSTAKESLKETLKIISCSSDNEMQYLYKNFDEECLKLISMDDILLVKDTDQMIDYQSRLYDKIDSKHNVLKNNIKHFFNL